MNLTFPEKNLKLSGEESHSLKTSGKPLYSPKTVRAKQQQTIDEFIRQEQFIQGKLPAAMNRQTQGCSKRNSNSMQHSQTFAHPKTPAAFSQRVPSYVKVPDMQKSNVGSKTPAPPLYKNKNKHRQKNKPSAQMILPAFSRPESLATQAYGADAVKTTKELLYEYTDFFDWEHTGTSPSHPVKSVLYDPEQPLFPGHSSISDSSNTLARLQSCTVWVLPRSKEGANSSSGFIVLAGVAGVETGYATSEPKLSGVQNTIVQPDFNVKWRKVLHYRTDQLFGDNLFVPLSGTNGGLEAFRLACVEMDTGSPLPTGEKIQVRYTLKFACTQAVAGEASLAVAGVSNWVERPTSTLSRSFVISAITGMRDTSA